MYPSELTMTPEPKLLSCRSLGPPPNWSKNSGPKKSLKGPEKGESRSGAATFLDVEMFTTAGRADLTMGVNPERNDTSAARAGDSPARNSGTSWPEVFEGLSRVVPN